MRPQRFCSHPAAMAIPASSLLLASPTQHPQRDLKTASGGGFKRRWGERGDKATKLPSHPFPIPPKEAETQGLGSPSPPREKNNSWKLGRDAEARSASTPLTPGVPQGCTGAPVLSQDVHSCGAPGITTGQCNSRGHLLAWVILDGREDPFFISSPPCRRRALPQRAVGGTPVPPAPQCFVLPSSADSLIKPSLRWGHQGQALSSETSDQHHFQPPGLLNELSACCGRYK